MKTNNTNRPQPATQLKLKKESIAVLSAPVISITGGSFGPTASCACTATC